ncbi:MAG: hypothetical protein GQ583_09510 [Methyloprofundus sp.]|nr:hypothetical protein [Methyloprofundus sp.]
MLSKTQSLGHWEWVIYVSSLVIMVSAFVIVFFRQQSSENLQLKYQQSLLDEQAEALQCQQKDYQQRLALLTQKEAEVKQKILHYQQYVEFPDNEAWQEDVEQAYFDDEIAELLHDRAKVIFDKIINKQYTENELINNDLIFKDIVDLIESVARLHHPESQNPLLETSIENLFRSLNRLSLQLLVLVDSFPVNIKGYNLRKTYLYIQKSTRTFGYYKKAEPFLSFATPMLRVGLVAANPVLGLAQSAAIEAGKHVIKKSSEKYALNLLHDVIAIIGEQATTIFGDASLRYRSKHWIYALELTEILYYFKPVTPEAFTKAMKIISGLSIRSEHDRIFLYHCMAQGKSANPDSYANDFINIGDKQQLADKLSEFIENYVYQRDHEESAKKITRWRNKVERRLGIEVQLKLDKNDAEYLKNRLSSGSPEKKIKPLLARYILAIMQDEETPQFIYTDISIDIAPSLLKFKELWLIVSNKRLLLLAAEKEPPVQLLWRYDFKQNKPLLVQRLNRVVADDCRIVGGVWQAELQIESEPEFILKGRNIGSYESYFGVLDDLQ